MIKAILLTLMVVFACLGISEFIHTIKSMCLYSGVKSNNYCILILRHGFSAGQLRYYAYKLRWYGNEFCDRIIAITDDLNESEIADCEKYCYGANIFLCNYSQMSLIINSFETGEINVE